MEWSEMQRARMALFAELVSRIPANAMGRTMLMKLCYFLQELKGVPLGYHFSIYSYGPFDAEVLSDLGSAVNLDAVKSTVVYNKVGYGYQLEAGPSSNHVRSEGSEFLHQHQESIDWAIEEFGHKLASDLELESTSVFVDRDSYMKNESLTLEVLTKRVMNLKPHFSESFILSRAQELYQKGYFLSVN